MQFDHQFVVKAPADKVWAYLIDPYRVAPALPGAAITEKIDDSTYAGTITVKVGPVSARYKGTAHFESLDAVARVAEVAASGQESSGRGGATMHMISRLVELAPAETQVSVTSQVNVTGLLAQLGRGLMQDVSDQLLERFTQAMRADLEEPGATATAGGLVSGAPGMSTAGGNANVLPSTQQAPPIEVVSFGGRLLARAATRAVRRPAFWVAVVAVIAVIYLIWFR